MLIALTLLALQTQPMGVAPGPLPKAEADRRVAERFADLDLNEDGSIERDEVRARFDFDASTDATFTAAQKAKKASDPRASVEARLPAFARADAWFVAVDTDKDGKIARAELAAHMGADGEQLWVK
ncbi:EF-hand domain-containing protein [Sphingomonas sp. LT1P40]|uniref:EF-hand domain-containing protein n=1 Tax=Alteristakelama amylovorans TaxID=3096166 RepID=UPI002FCCB7A8